MFEGPIAGLKHKIDLAWKSAVGGFVALIAALVAISFFCAAAFMWLEQKLDPIAAALIIGGFFLLLSLVAGLIVILVQRTPPPPPPRHKSLWSDPALLATALDIGRTLGPRRAATAVLIGAFLIGMMINRPPHKPGQ